MAMGREGDRQGDLIVTWAEMPRSPGHVFYDRLQKVLMRGGFDAFVEKTCKPYYAPRMGAPSLPPGRYFRMHMVGYFEGIDSERGIAWRCSDSLSLRDFLRLENRDKVPDHSWLSKTRSRLPHEVHEKVFGWVLKLVAEHGLVKGERIGVDGSTMEANAALRTIVRRDNGETYREMLTQMAKESGIETPTTDDLVRLDRNRKGKKLSNEEWTSKTDPEAKIAKMKDGSTHLAYKPEHAVDLDTGVIVAAPIHPADEGDTTTIERTLAAAEKNLAAVSVAPTAEEPSELVADKGYHSRAVLKDLDGGAWKTRIAEPKPAGLFALARRQGACGGLRQPHPLGFGGRQGGDATAGGNRRAKLRPQSRPRRHAPDLAARTRKRPQALSGPRRRPQSRHPDAAADRGRNAKRGGRHRKCLRLHHLRPGHHRHRALRRVRCRGRRPRHRYHRQRWLIRSSLRHRAVKVVAVHAVLGLDVADDGLDAARRFISRRMEAVTRRTCPEIQTRNLCG